MRPSKRSARWAAMAVAMCVTSIIHGLGLQISTADPRRFAFNGDGDLLYVYPGNRGAVYLQENPPQENPPQENPPSDDPSNLEPWQDVYCDSRWLDLAADGYTYNATDSQTTGAAEYWERLASFNGSCTFSGDVPFWIITDAFVLEWENHPELLDELTSQVLTYIRKGLLDPTFVFRPEQWTPAHNALRKELNAGLPGWPIGGYVTPENYSSIPHRELAFIVGEEEIIPAGYRGQSAPQWMRAQFGEVPVMIAPRRPDFQRDMIWIGGGAAGIWFRPLPEKGTLENHHAAIHLRATSTFLNRFGLQPVQLLPHPGHKNLKFSLKAGEEGWAAVLTGGAELLDLQVPENLQGQVVGTNWFNPATDENIISPINRLISDSVKVKPPSSSLWVYSIVKSRAAPDTATTVSEIKENLY